MEQTFEQEVKQRFRLLQVIWIAILMTLIIYLFVCHIVGAAIELDESAEAAIDVLVLVFYILAAAQLFLAHFLRRALLRPGKPDPASPPREAQTGQVRRQILAKYSAAVIVSLAISESVAIFGLVLFFLTGNFQTLYILMVVSAVSMIVNRPKEEELSELLPGLRLD
jgi:hypothetical protein